jgi:hypothetical protein
MRRDETSFIVSGTIWPINVLLGACPITALVGQVLLVTPACYPRHLRRGEPRTGCGIPATIIGLAACGGRGVKGVGDPAALCCSSGCPNELVASGVPGSGGKPPRPLEAKELLGRPPRAAHVSRKWLLASNKVSGSTVRLLLTSVFGAVMIIAPEASILLSGVRMI